MSTEFQVKFILALIATTTFYIFEVKSSFDKTYSLLSKNEVSYTRKNLNRLLHNLNNRTNIEFAIYNSKIGLFLYTFSFFLASFCSLSVSTNIGKYILPFLGFVVLFFSEIYVYSRKMNIYKMNIYISSWKTFWLECAYKYGKLFIYNALSLCFILTSLLILQQFFKTDPNLFIDTIYSGVVNTTVNTTILHDNKPLELISGNKFSFSGILFTLGIGGTVVFSLANYYTQQNELINQNTLKLKKYYQTWFKLNKNEVNFDPKKYDEFNVAVNLLRKEFHQYVKINNYTRIYKFALLLIFLVYVMGIFVVIGSDFIVELIFKLFPLISFIFLVILLFVFTYLENSSSQQSDNMNHSSFEGRSIYEFVDTTQTNYEKEETDKNMLQKKNHKL